MTAPIRIVTALPEYRVAVASLPLMAELSTDASGAVVVIDGAAAWWDAAAIAVDAGARAVLVTEPVVVPEAAVRALAVRADVPILVHRTRLRGELVRMALEHRDGTVPRVIVAECQACAPQLPVLVRDAAGWLRELGQTPLRVLSASVGTAGGTALLNGGNGIHASIVITPTAVEGMVVRVQALGETASDIEIDERMRRVELSTATRRGRLVAPTLFESPEREALRRCIVAAGDGGRTDDVESLLHDADLAARILGTAESPIFG